MAFEIEGKGFLWHQVCSLPLFYSWVPLGSLYDGSIVLYWKRKGRASSIHFPSIFTSFQLIANLLDIEKNPYKPLYMMADPNPLCLYECKYDKEECNFENSLSERARRELRML